MERTDETVNSYLAGYRLGSCWKYGDRDQETCTHFRTGHAAGWQSAGEAVKRYFENPPREPWPAADPIACIEDTDGVKIWQGDALAVLRSLPSNVADTWITDPPYSSGGLFRGDRTTPAAEKYVQSGQALQWEDFGGDNRDQRSYLMWCTLWLTEALRITKPGGILAMFTDWRQLPITTDALQAGGWVWRGVGVWDKTEAARPRKGAYRNQCEYLVWGSKGVMPDAGECLPGVWRYSVGASEKHHIAGKPEKLMQDLVKICPEGGLLVDSFCGSGTTLKACKLMGRRAWGIDCGEYWARLSADRVREVMLLPGMIPTPAVLPQPQLFHDTDNPP